MIKKVHDMMSIMKQVIHGPSVYCDGCSLIRSRQDKALDDDRKVSIGINMW